MVKQHDLVTLFPSFAAAQETGARRGSVVLTRQGENAEQLASVSSLVVEGRLNIGVTGSRELIEVGSTTSVSDVSLLVLEPSPGFVRLDLRDIWTYRELL